MKRHFLLLTILLCALLVLPAGPASATPIYDTYSATVGYDGLLVDGGGSGWVPDGADGPWILYQGEGWYPVWVQWFYNDPEIWDHYKIIDYSLLLTPEGPEPWAYVEINWTLPTWTGDDPPLDPVLWEDSIGYYSVFEGALFEPVLLSGQIVIPDFNPEWVSIDILGADFIIDGWIEHECLPQNPVPIPGAVWLLGSGLLGLAGFRKKLFN